MRYIIILSAFLVSSLSFAQKTSSISGVLMDAESNRVPLKYGKVSIKETGKEVFTDENGLFKFENIKEGTYTLTYSFVGYETKESKTKITFGKNNHITMSLSTSRLSFDDILLALDCAVKKDDITANNN